jgi:linoleate 10R-lipoxygenase
MPELGAVGHTYARSCKPKVTQLGAQPDPEAVYEAVMARGVFKRNPNNVSSILWYWATIIIHGGCLSPEVWRYSIIFSHH